MKSVVPVSPPNAQHVVARRARRPALTAHPWERIAGPRPRPKRRPRGSPPRRRKARRASTPAPGRIEGMVSSRPGRRCHPPTSSRRRHQTWERESTAEGIGALDEREEFVFVPAIVGSAASSPAVARPSWPRRRRPVAPQPPLGRPRHQDRTPRDDAARCHLLRQHIQ